jgi:hypothetical protein
MIYMVLEPTLHDVLDAINTLSSNTDERFERIESTMATKDGVFSIKSEMAHFATKDDLRAVKDELLTHIDGLTGLHQKNELEILALRSRFDRLEARP